MMQAFRFRLQSVLDQRLGEERRKQKEVAEIEIERIGLENRLREINRSIQGEKTDWRDRVAGRGPSTRTGVVDLRGARMQAGASIHLIAEAQRLVLKLAGVHTRLERARGALLEATTRKRAVELLKEKYYEAWIKERNRKESVEQDDMTVMRHGRSHAAVSEVLR